MVPDGRGSRTSRPAASFQALWMGSKTLFASRAGHAHCLRKPYPLVKLMPGCPSQPRDPRCLFFAMNSVLYYVPVLFPFPVMTLSSPVSQKTRPFLNEFWPSPTGCRPVPRLGRVRQSPSGVSQCQRLRQLTTKLITSTAVYSGQADAALVPVPDGPRPGTGTVLQTCIDRSYSA